MQYTFVTKFLPVELVANLYNSEGKNIEILQSALGSCSLQWAQYAFEVWFEFFFVVVMLCQYHDFSSSFTVEKIEFFSTVNTVEKIQSTLHTFWHNCWRHRYGFGGGLLRERREKKITLV